MKNIALLVALAAFSSAPVAFAAPQTPSLLALAGYERLDGEGVVLTLSDRAATAPSKNPGVMLGLVHDYDVLMLVNELRAAGAQGISVGGVRLTNQVGVRCIGSQLRVGRSAVKIPLKIEAVGDAAMLKSHLEVVFGVLQQLGSHGPKIELRAARVIHLGAAPRPKIAATRSGFSTTSGARPSIGG